MRSITSKTSLDARQFELGQCVVTDGILETLTSSQVQDVLDRHVRGDWGEVGEEDARQNDWSLKNGERLMSAYTVDGTKVWVITERDRSATTILLPSEY